MTERRDPKQEDRMPERDTERLLAEWFEDEAPRQEPPVLLPAVLARTALTRRRRKWLTRDWWLSVLGLIDRRPPSMMVSVGFIAILTALALTAAFVVAPGGADNEKIERPADALVVAADGSGDFTTVRAAVDAAADGDTIFIEPGTYDESIGVDKSLSFIGGGNVAADVVIRAAASEPQALRVEGADVTLRRLAIERADPDAVVETPSGINILRGSIEIDDVEFLGIPDASCGLRSDAGNIFVGEGESVDVRVTVRDSRFGGSGADAIGICAGTIGSVTIERSSFEGLGLGLEGEAAEYDITDSTFRSNGIGLSAIGDVSIRNNAFLGNREGAISNGNGERNDVIIEGNDFVENGTAVRVGDRGWFQVKGNSFAGGQVGVRFSDGAPGSIVENDFRDLESSAIESRSAGPLIDGNTISGGLDGIVLRASDSWLMGNTIEGVRGTAIAVDASSDPKVVGNKLCDNGVGLDIPQGVGSTIGGNSTCTDAENRTWNVAQDGSGDFTTIGDAVDAAIDGDVVLVQPGIYDESIVVGKDVSITGQPDGSEVVVEVSAPFPRPRDDASMDRLNYDDPPFAFWIVDSDAVLENMTIRGRSSTIIVAGGAPTLTNLELDGLGFIFRPPGQDLIPFMGLSFEGRSSGQLTDSLVKDTELLVWGEADVEVQGNTFDGGSITLEGAGTDAIVTGNRLANSNKWGIAVWNGASPVISDNDIIGASTGIDVYAVTNPVIRANNIYDDEGFVDLVARADAGDLPEFITAAEIRGNRISESSVAGIGVHEYASATIESNEVRDNQVGISLVRPGEISIGDNTFCGNEQNLAASDAAAPPIGGSNEICEDT